VSKANCYHEKQKINFYMQKKSKVFFWKKKQEAKVKSPKRKNNVARFIPTVHFSMCCCVGISALQNV